jgi:hypothetical protein
MEIVTIHKLAAKRSRKVEADCGFPTATDAHDDADDHHIVQLVSGWPVRWFQE